MKNIKSAVGAVSRRAVAFSPSKIGHRYTMRCAALLAIVLASAGFASEPARVSAVQQRAARTVEATTFDGWKATRDRDTGAIVSLWGKSISVPGSIANPAIGEE